MFNPDQLSPDFHKVLEEQNAAAVEEMKAVCQPPEGTPMTDHQIVEKIRDDAVEMCSKMEYHFEQDAPTPDGVTIRETPMDSNAVHKALNELREQEAKADEALPDDGPGPSDGRDDDGDGADAGDAPGNGGLSASAGGDSDSDGVEETSEEPDGEAEEKVGAVGTPESDKAVALTDKEKDHEDLKVFMHVPLVDLVHKKREFESSLEDIEYTVKAMRDMTNDPKGQQTLIDQMNSLERLGLNFKTTEEFYTKYEELRKENTRIVALLSNVIKRIVPGDTHSVAFLARSMVEALNARLEAMEKDPEKADTMQHDALVRTRDGYLHREDQDYLMRKVFVAHTIYKLCKDVYKENPAESIKLVDRVLSGTFNDKGMLRFRKILIKTMLASNQNGCVFGSQSRIEFIAFAFTYWLAKLSDDEARTGKAIPVRMFIMNTYDQADPTADYDLPGGAKLHMATTLTLLQVFAYIERSTSERTIRACCDAVAHIKDQIMANYEADKTRYIEEAPGADMSEVQTTLAGTATKNSPYSAETIAAMIEEELEELRQKRAAEDEEEYEEDGDEEYEDEADDDIESGEIITDDDEEDDMGEDDIAPAPANPDQDAADYLPDPDDEIHRGDLVATDVSKVYGVNDATSTVKEYSKPFVYTPDYSPDDMESDDEPTPKEEASVKEEPALAEPNPPTPPSSGIAN